MSLDPVRWRKEKRLMRERFPQFKTFIKPPMLFGFEGYLKGKNGRLFEVVLEADEREYPTNPIAVYMNPSIGHHWIDDGRLCVDSDHWKPGRSSFANWLLRSIEYLETNNVL